MNKAPQPKETDTIFERFAKAGLAVFVGAVALHASADILFSK